MAVLLALAHPAFAKTVETQSLGLLDQILSTLAGLALAIAEVIGKLVIAVLDITIPVMQYQGFTNSPVVTAGWSLVRDTVNMFFVVVLIIIAMGTIFGHSRFQWKQQVPKLLIFALLINFSKTLCGIMIDFAQVVMITFANALKDIAGGNFIQLLGLGDIFSISEKAATIMDSASGTGTGASAFDWFAAGLAAVLMMVWVLAVVLMLLAVLVYRVVMLWILIVISPLAWFMGGQSVFKSDSYAEWWRNFVCYTAIGPVITFFLWLTLAVAGSGFIAANDPGLSSVAPAGDLTSNASDFVTQIFEWQRLTSFVVGMAMLMAGFDAASKICHGVKGPGFQQLLSYGKGVPATIGSYIGGKANKYGSKGLTAGWSGTKSLAAGTGVAAMTFVAGGGTLKDKGERLLPTRAGQAARAEGLRTASKRMPGQLIGISRKMSMAADKRQASLAETMKKAAGETYKDASDETKIDTLIRMANGNEHAFEGAENIGLLSEALKNPKVREKLEAAGVLGTLVSKHLPSLKKQLRGTKDYEAIDEFEAGRPDLTGNFNTINTMEDVEKLDPTALARLRIAADDPDNELGQKFMERMMKVKSNTKQKRIDPVTGREDIVTLNAWEHFEAGFGSVKKQNAWKKGMTGVYEGMGKPALDLVPVEEIAVSASEELLNRRPDAAVALMSSTNGGIRLRAHADQASYESAANKALGLKFAGGSVSGIDTATLRKAVKNDPAVLTNVSTRDIERNQPLAEGIADVLDDSAIKGITRQYQKASDEDKAEMDASLIENTFSALDHARKAAMARGDLATANNYDQSMLTLQKNLEKIDTNRADLNTRLTNRIIEINAEIATERASPNGNPLNIAKLTEDIRRLRERVSRYP